MKSEEQDNLKNVITGRFITAVDYLVDSGKVNSMTELEKETGIRAQRIAGMRSSVSGDGKSPQYVQIHQIKLVKDYFNVSMDFIFDGEKPIVKDSNSLGLSMAHEVKMQEYVRKDFEMKEKISILEQRIELLNEKVEFYKEVINQKP